MKIWLVVAGAAAVTALLAAQSLAKPAPESPPRQVTILRDDLNRLGIRTDSADWWIAKRCLGRSYWRVRGLTTGPGYVYLVRRDGAAIVDDEAEPILDDADGGLNPYGSSGGLGSFGYQHARGIPPFTFDRAGGVNSWWVSGRVCARDHPQKPGFGVSERCCRVGGLRWEDDGSLRWSIAVSLRTPWQDPILRIRYEYVFSRDVVRLRTTVRSFCARPTCGDAPYQHVVKEPKFTMQVVPAAGDTITVADPSGAELARWAGGHPRKGTGQVATDTRDSVTFTASGLTVAARGADGPWEGSGSGLDRWAVEAATASRPPSDVDGPAPPHYASGHDTKWDCNGGSTAGQEVRRWELVGGAAGFPLAVFFHGWEGGVGHNDCEPAARTFPPPAEAFVNEFDYRFEPGPVPGTGRAP